MSIRERILSALREGTILRGTSLMTERDKEEAHVHQTKEAPIGAMAESALLVSGVLIKCRNCNGTGKASPSAEAFGKVYHCTGCSGAGVVRV